ncbi:MAG: hypothetical protein J2P18_09330 [Nocardia sp.]|nr:hypothetical protein [Nocardia sp.]
MRPRPTAFGWIEPEISTAWEWDRAQIHRLSRRLGYALIWAPIDSALPLVDQVRAADVDVVIIPAPNHLDTATLHAFMCIVSVETATPRMSFAPWAHIPSGLLG